MTLINLPKEQNTSAKHTGLIYRLYLADLCDVDVDNFPKSVNATISNNVLLPGKTFKFLDVKTESIKPNAAPGESPYTGKLTLTPIIEGISKATLSWLYANKGREVIAIWERCSDGQKFIGGSPCSSGLTIKFTAVGAQDGGVAGIALSLEGGDCAEPFWFYDGQIPLESPVAVSVAAGKITITSKSSYIIQDNASVTSITDIIGVTDADVGRVIELIGAGVENSATIAPSSKFILRNGLIWSASVGSRIFLQISKTGASAYCFYEIHRG